MVTVEENVTDVVTLPALAVVVALDVVLLVPAPVEMDAQDVKILVKMPVFLDVQLRVWIPVKTGVTLHQQAHK